MPYDTNNMFGVLADPESMSLLTTRGRSKQFEKETGEEFRKQTLVITIVKNIDKVPEDLDLGGEKEGIKEAETEGEGTGKEAVNPTIHATPITPAAPCVQHLSIDTDIASPCTNTSGKPSHRRRRDLSDVEDQHPLTPLTPTTPSCISTPHPQPREYFSFTNEKAYTHARALFAITSEPGHPSSLRWNQLVSLVTSPPISCKMIQNRNSIEVKVIRPARTSMCIVNTGEVVIEEGKEGAKVADCIKEGAKEVEGSEESAKEGTKVSSEMTVEMTVEKRSVVLHKPHGQNGWVERHMLDHMATAMSMKFGWERGDFVKV